MVYRIDDTTAVSALPALPTDNIGQPGFFTGGSTAGQSPTRVRYWWLNMVQEELINIAQAGGIPFDKTKNDQCIAAIKKLVSSMASSAVMGAPSTLASGDVAGSILYYSGAETAPVFIYGNQTAVLLTSSALNSYATQAWANGQFLRLSSTAAQAVTSSVTFSGITTVPTPTDYTKNQAIGASDADARYARLTGGNGFNGPQSFDSNSYMGLASAWTGAQLNSPHTVYRVGTAASHIYVQGTSADSCSLAFVLQPGDGTETDMVLFKGGILQTSGGQVAFTSQLPHTTYSGNAGDAGSYTITKYTDPSTPSGYRYRISGQTAAYTDEGWQTISLPITLNGVLPGAWGCSMFWPSDSSHNNDQVAQITATPTVSTIQVNVDTFGTGTPTWPCYVTWFLEGY